MGCSNGNERFTGRLLSNYGPLNMLFHFFRYLIYSFSQGFCQKVSEETILFQLKFQKSISRWSILQKIRMSNFVILKWRLFEYKVKSWKICPFLGLFWIFMTQIFWKWFLVPHKMTYMGLLLLKLRLDKLESRLLSSNWYIF